MIIAGTVFYDEQLNELQRYRAVLQVRLGKPVKKYLFIVRVEDDQNLLQILTHREMKRMMERGKVMALAGVAKDREGAFQVVEDIAVSVAGACGTMTKETLDKELGIRWTHT